MRATYYFKLFNSIKSNHEVNYLAKIEIESLFGTIQEKANILELLTDSTIRKFIFKNKRVQDILTYELPYGDAHGYIANRSEIINISKLIKRLAYTREIFVFVPKADVKKDTLSKLFDGAKIGYNAEVITGDSLVFYRFTTHQYYLEKSQYISKISRNEEETRKNVETLFSHLIQDLYRIPASSTMSIGKRLEDYFAIREEPSLYLNHYMHPYKGKFHPKMVRALINYVNPNETGIILDNFAGSGTTLVEAGYLGLDSLGVEINPLSALMCNVKTNSIFLDLDRLMEEYNNLIETYNTEIRELQQFETKQLTLNNLSITPQKPTKTAITKIKAIKTEISQKSPILSKYFNDNKLLIKIIVMRDIISQISNREIKEFLLLVLSGTISDLLRRTKRGFLEVFETRYKDLFLRLYLFHELNKLLRIEKRKSTTFVSDTRNMFQIETESVTAIVNSPPYSTALDYIKNDEPQLLLLDLIQSFEELNKNMIGNPRINYSKVELREMLEDNNKNPISDVERAMKYVHLLIKNNREKDGYRVFKFFLDMYHSLKEMHRVLIPQGKAAIVIGNNHYKIDSKYIEIPNASILKDMALKIGFSLDMQIERELQKTSVGNIRKETILIIQKR